MVSDPEPGTEEVLRLQEYLRAAHDDDRLKARDLLDCCWWVLPTEQITEQAMAAAPSDELRDEIAVWLANDGQYIAELSPEAVDLLVDAVDVHDQEVYAKLSNHSPEEIPSWFYLTPLDIETGWLVHFTNHASDVAADGFLRGSADPSRLGLTTYMGEHDLRYGGYNFAYPVEGAERYAYGRGGVPKYGREAVLLRAPYLLVSHSTDEEPQAIFWGSAARDITRVRGTRGSWWLADESGEDHEFETLEEAAAWLDERADNPAGRDLRAEVLSW